MGKIKKNLKNIYILWKNSQTFKPLAKLKLSQYCSGKVEENMEVEELMKPNFKYRGPTSPGTQEVTFPFGASYLHETWR